MTMTWIKTLIATLIVCAVINTGRGIYSEAGDDRVRQSLIERNKAETKFFEVSIQDYVDTDGNHSELKPQAPPVNRRHPE